MVLSPFDHRYFKSDFRLHEQVLTFKSHLVNDIVLSNESSNVKCLFGKHIVLLAPRSLLLEFDRDLLSLELLAILMALKEDRSLLEHLVDKSRTSFWIDSISVLANHAVVTPSYLEVDAHQSVFAARIGREKA